jgi:hypothetical protein
MRVRFYVDDLPILDPKHLVDEAEAMEAIWERFPDANFTPRTRARPTREGGNTAGDEIMFALVNGKVVADILFPAR